MNNNYTSKYEIQNNINDKSILFLQNIPDGYIIHTNLGPYYIFLTNNTEYNNNVFKLLIEKPAISIHIHVYDKPFFSLYETNTLKFDINEKDINNYLNSDVMYIRNNKLEFDNEIKHNINFMYNNYRKCLATDIDKKYNLTTFSIYGINEQAKDVFKGLIPYPINTIDGIVFKWKKYGIDNLQIINIGNVYEINVIEAILISIDYFSNHANYSNILSFSMFVETIFNVDFYLLSVLSMLNLNIYSIAFNLYYQSDINNRMCNKIYSLFSVYATQDIVKTKFPFITNQYKYNISNTCFNLLIKLYEILQEEELVKLVTFYGTIISKYAKNE